MAGTPPSPQGTSNNQTVIDGGTQVRNAMPSPQLPGADGGVAVKLKITCTIVGGGALSTATIVAVNEASEKRIKNNHLCIAYEDEVKVGGSLAWRANNPGNLRRAESKIGTVRGEVGNFAVFASLEQGRAAQRELYLTTYGDMKVKDAIGKLTPPSENDTQQYLKDLKAAGVDLEKDVKSQIDPLMTAVQANEGLIEGITVKRVP
jgi:hypothetical protein